MALSCQRWGQECLQGLSLYSSWCYLGTYGRHQGIAIEKPNKCQSITSLRWNWSVNRTISVLWKSYSLEVCCGLIHACNKKWNSFVSTNYFFPVLVRNITFHGSHMECTSCQKLKNICKMLSIKNKIYRRDIHMYMCELCWIRWTLKTCLPKRSLSCLFPFLWVTWKRRKKTLLTTSAQDLNSEVNPKLAGYTQQRNFVMQIMTPLYAR